MLNNTSVYHHEELPLALRTAFTPSTGKQDSWLVRAQKRQQMAALWVELLLYVLQAPKLGIAPLLSRRGLIWSPTSLERLQFHQWAGESRAPSEGRRERATY